MQKLRRINKEKNFWEWTRKRRNPEDQLSAKPNHPAVPAVWACVRLLQEGEENNPCSHTSPCLTVFEGVWKDRIFQVSVGHPGKQDRDPIHKSAEFDEFHDPFQRMVFPEKLGWHMGSKMKQDKAVASPPLTPARNADRGNG